MKLKYYLNNTTILIMIIILLTIKIASASNSIYSISKNEINKHGEYKIVLPEYIESDILIDNNLIFFYTDKNAYIANESTGEINYKININNISEQKITDDYYILKTSDTIYKINKINGQIESKSKSTRLINSIYTDFNLVNFTFPAGGNENNDTKVNKSGDIMSGGLIISTTEGSGLDSYSPYYLGVYGHSSDSIGVYGRSENSNGVYGHSDYSNGVQGYSTHSHGVYGESDDSNGVVGYSYNSNGVYGSSENSIGTQGYSPYSIGVYGNSIDFSGVEGYSTNSNGVYGSSENSIGIQGYSQYSNGVYGSSQYSNGVYGDSIDYHGVYGGSMNSNGVHGYSDFSTGVYGESNNSIGMRSSNSITLDSLTGIGNAYACLDTNGTLYRSSSVCI